MRIVPSRWRRRFRARSHKTRRGWRQTTGRAMRLETLEDRRLLAVLNLLGPGSINVQVNAGGNSEQATIDLQSWEPFENREEVEINVEHRREAGEGRSQRGGRRDLFRRWRLADG